MANQNNGTDMGKDSNKDLNQDFKEQKGREHFAPKSGDQMTERRNTPSSDHRSERSRDSVKGMDSAEGDDDSLNVPGPDKDHSGEEIQLPRSTPPTKPEIYGNLPRNESSSGNDSAEKRSA